MAPVARHLSLGFGVLEPLQTSLSVDGQVDELQCALREHAQIPATLIGHSWGAWLGLLLASRWPELAAKLILVGCPPLAESYVSQIGDRRLDRLNDAERAEYRVSLAALSGPASLARGRLLERLGRLAAKADAYEAAEAEEEPGVVCVSAEIYRAVWSEASAVRQSGELLRRALTVACPVVAIHGDADSHPAAGVAEPLAALRDFRMIMLPRCGHTPWIERYAKDDFYRTLLAEIG